MNMMIGEGVIFNRFIDYSLQSKYFIFTGHIHDSTIQDESIIAAEESSLAVALSVYFKSTFIYFSSCSILDTSVENTQYVQHKIRMEKMIQNSGVDYLIFRVPQIIGHSDSQSSLVNLFIDSIMHRKPIDVWQYAKRNFIDIDDVHEIVSKILSQNWFKNKIINIASSRQTSIIELVREIEKLTGHSSCMKLVDKGSEYEINISEIEPLLINLKIDFNKDYLYFSLKKYYHHLVMRPKQLSIIIPTYNEEQGIEEFYRRTKNVLMRLTPRFEHEMIFINDCSSDDTLAKIELLALLDTSVKVINFSRNFGNQVAIAAGIDYSRGDIAVIIDDDLQDPPEIILNMIAKWDKGYKVVYGVRPNRRGINIIFNMSAKLYYRIIGNLSDISIPLDTGDFRLVDRVVLDALKEIKEESRYYRGLVSWVGFPQIGIEYQRDKRFAGISTFSFSKYLNFAINGVTSFSEKPLVFSSLLGAFITLVGFVLAILLIMNKLLDPEFSIQGWTSLVVISLFFGGIQLFSIGILGIYIGKIFRQVKGRPLYVVAGTKNIENQNAPF